MRILLCQINPTIGDLKGNHDKIVSGIARAKEQSADLVVFPELALTGYPPEDFLLLPHFIQEVEKQLQAIAATTEGITALVGTCRRNPTNKEKKLFNSAAMMANGRIVGFQDKMLLPAYDVFDERRYFEPGQSHQLLTINGSRVAITICEDIWQHSEVLPYTDYSIDPIIALKKQKPDLLINLSASPFCIGKAEERLQICRRAAMSVQCPLLLCNQVGGNDSLIFDGRSIYLDEAGHLNSLASAFKEEDLLADLKASSHEITFKSNNVQDLYDALVMGIRDYFQKQGFSKACVGLSGGIDSAVVVALAAAALGKENVLAVLMPSRYSSEHSLNDSLALIQAFNIPSKTISIEPSFQCFLDVLTPHFSDLPFDTAEENLQARIRGIILMALSNKLGYIVLSTGNKSELAMGYATLYGDMCGGLAVLSDVTKSQVYALGRWINRQEPLIPQNIFNKPPSAELRNDQRDSDTLPPYGIIDNVLSAYVEEHQSPQEIASRFQYPKKLVEELVRRIHRNEYKRRQSAPGLRVSRKAFSVGRHFPIVQKFH